MPFFQMDKHKAPSPDGFGAAFFQDHWHIMHPDVCHAIKLLFLDSRLLRKLNHTFIVLIPKVVNPTTAAQFRPISLCNTL